MEALERIQDKKQIQINTTQVCLQFSYIFVTALLGPTVYNTPKIANEF